MPNYYYSGQGSLYAAERDPITGRAKGFVPVGNIPELTVDIEVTKFEHKESESGNRLVDLTLTKEKKGKFKFKLENLSADNLAMALYGTTATVAGGTIAVGSPETLYIPSGGKSRRYPVAHPDISSVVVKDATNTTTYTTPTDYTVDAKNGEIIIPATGAIATACASVDITIKVSYTYASYTNMEAFTSAVAPQRWLRFEGLNTVDGTRVIVDLYKVQFDPLTNYGLIVEDLASVDISGDILADSFILSGSQFFRQRNVAA